MKHKEEYNLSYIADTKLQITVRKKKLGGMQTYMGYMSCFYKGRKLWAMASGVHRLVPEDALKDAQIMVNNFENVKFDGIGIGVNA